MKSIHPTTTIVFHGTRSLRRIKLYQMIVYDGRAAEQAGRRNGMCGAAWRAVTDARQIHPHRRPCRPIRTKASPADAAAIVDAGW